MFIVTRQIPSKLVESIEKLYKQGYSCQEIKDTLHVPVDVRSIQRLVKKMGITRSPSDAFRNAIKRGRVHFHYQPNKIKRKRLSPKVRYQVLSDDDFKCVKCGSSLLVEVDHIDEDKNNNKRENLQTLCHECNIGKSWYLRYPPKS